LDEDDLELLEALSPRNEARNLLILNLLSPRKKRQPRRPLLNLLLNLDLHLHENPLPSLLLNLPRNLLPEANPQQRRKKKKRRKKRKKRKPPKERKVERKPKRKKRSKINLFFCSFVLCVHNFALCSCCKSDYSPLRVCFAANTPNCCQPNFFNIFISFRVTYHRTLD
jgi:hypothetical protein